MDIESILKVVGAILLKFRGINPRSLASLSEESDFYFHLGLRGKEFETLIAEIERYYHLEPEGNVFEHTDMKWWIQNILEFGELAEGASSDQIKHAA